MNNKLNNILTSAGFDPELLDGMGVMVQVENAVKLLVEECAIVAELQSRSYSDGDAGAGSIAAANAVRHFGKTLGV